MRPNATIADCAKRNGRETCHRRNRDATAELPWWPPLIALAFGVAGLLHGYVISKRFDRFEREENERARNGRSAE